MKLSERHHVERAARIQLIDFLLAWEREHGLSVHEMNRLLAERITDMASHYIRDGRQAMAGGDRG